MGDWKPIEGVADILSMIAEGGDVMVRHQRGADVLDLATLRERPALMNWAEQLNYGVFDGRKPEPRVVKIDEKIKSPAGDSFSCSLYLTHIDRICFRSGSGSNVFVNRETLMDWLPFLRDFAYNNITTTEPDELAELQARYDVLGEEIKRLKKARASR